MPGPTVHLCLVREAAERWERGTAPVDLDAPGVREALYLGAVAPDAGYYPGGQPFITDLAHYVRTGVLARTLLAEASTDVERAFAWGWTSHVVLDSLMHPAVNRAAAEVHNGTGALTYAADPETHVRIEVGLDAYFDARYGTPPLYDALGTDTDPVRRAYRATYGAEIDAGVFTSTFRAQVRFHGPLLTITRLTHATFTTRGVSARLAGAGLAAGGLLARSVVRSPAAGLFHGVEPSGAFLAAVETALADYHVSMDRHVETGLAELPDYNLDTGTPEKDARDYPLTVQTQQQLKEYREK